MSKIDWGPIEKDYRETKTPVSTLVKAYKVTHSAITTHMSKHGVVRNPLSALPIPIDNSIPIVKDITSKELIALRNAVVAGHRDDIQLNRKRLALISERLDAMTGLSNMQRLNALKVILQCQETIIKLERQAHNIVEEAPAPPPVAIQVNVNLDPQDAYLKLIGRK